jgi:glucosamine--fructose-6-phosphate aminotransferase (isomerizing)
MMKEILEQPMALKRTFDAERDHALAFADLARKKNFRLVVLVARGTSDNAALFGRYLIELTTGIPVSMCAPSIHTLYHARMDLRQALVVGVSQSGEGTDINLVLEAAKRQGAYTLAITNEARSAMAGLADDVFVGRAGRQCSVAATKTYTSQLMLLYMLAASVSSQITLSGVSEIPQHVEETLKLAPEIKEMVRRYHYMRRCVVVARGINYANAFELSLKLMETCYVVAERFSGADFLHGPIAMIERDFPVMLFNPPGSTFRDVRKLTEHLRALKADTLVFTSTKAKVPGVSEVIRIPDNVPEIYTPIPYIVPGQIFASYLAEEKGLNPDKPRELHIVTRTV